MAYEVPQPIINSPYDEPAQHWHIEEGQPCELRPGRRSASYYYRPPKASTGAEEGSDVGTRIELKLVNQVRDLVKRWRTGKDGGEPYAGVTRVTMELLQWWRREGRKTPLFFAQLEAVETIIFLTEARPDLRQGVQVPRDEPTEEWKAKGYSGFPRMACKMATGSGKTTVMGMLAAWSVLNKLASRNDARFSDAVLVVCPNLTIRERLQELDPKRGDVSIYRTRDLVPPHLMSRLSQGKLMVTNWHAFSPLELSGSNRVDVRGEESDAALVGRVLGHDLGKKQNILVLNDEAHHAYRIRQEEDPFEEEVFGDEEDAAQEANEANVWVHGLDRVSKTRGVKLCVDLSATPYFLARVGRDVNRPFPWIVSDFGLVDAIESGLVKIPQLAIRDSTGATIPAYFNIWRWILPQLTASEKGGSRGQVKPEAILKWAHTPVAQLGGLWKETFDEWEKDPESHPTPPVFIIVCKNTRLAKVVYEWLAEDNRPPGIPPSRLDWFRNRDGILNTIRVDSKVVHETDSGSTKDTETRWMRFVLDTIGKTDWPRDRQGRPQYPVGFEEIAEKRAPALGLTKEDLLEVPPGAYVRCIVSVSMLTEGWDCTTVTHIVGLRPFMSQLLCEQVVGRALRRTSYEVGPNGMFSEQVAKLFGVPFEVIPFKADAKGTAAPAPKRWHVQAIPSRAPLAISFPRVDGYISTLQDRIKVDWEAIPSLHIEPGRIPPEVQVKGLSVNEKGRLSLHGPGKADDVTLQAFRREHRLQQLEFELAQSVTHSYAQQSQGSVPIANLFSQIYPVVKRYLADKVRVGPGADKKDIFLSPYYGWVVERISQAIRPDESAGETAERPQLERNRPAGSTADVDFWTARDVREVMKSHVNYVVADTKTWEQSAAYYIDRNARVEAFVKNAGLGFAIPYLDNGEAHEYVPDFIVRLKTADGGRFAILETKGYDPRLEIKKQAALRWVDAVNQDGRFGKWTYLLATDIEAVPKLLDGVR